MTQVTAFQNQKINRLYADVPHDQLDVFQAFRAAHPYKQAIIDGVEWAYLTGGDGEQVVLLLSGALNIPDISWMSIANFSKRYRVIAPAYPAVDTMDSLVDGIAEVLRLEGVGRAHVIGGSYGGFVAQVFLRRHPEMCRSLVLSHTFAPDPVTGGQIKKAMWWLSLLSTGLMRWLMGKQLGALMPKDAPDLALTEAIFKELLYHRLTKVDAMSSFRRMIDYCDKVFNPQDLKDWPGEMLLVLADDDPGTPQERRERLLALYPGAKMHLFHGTGHATALIKQEEYFAAIEAFLGGQLGGEGPTSAQKDGGETEDR